MFHVWYVKGSKFNWENHDEGIISILTDGYLDYTNNKIALFVKRNLCGHREEVKIMDLDCLIGVLTINVFASEKKHVKLFCLLWVWLK